MKITITDYEGKKHTGNWNGKTYSSKIKERDELYRVYIDDDMVHVEPDRFLSEVGINKRQNEYQMAERRVQNYIEYHTFNNYDKLAMLREILKDREFVEYYGCNDKIGLAEVMVDDEEKYEIKTLTDFYHMIFRKEIEEQEAYDRKYEEKQRRREKLGNEKSN